MKKEIFGGPRRTDAKATCAGRAGKRRTDPISTRRFFAKRSAEGSDGAKKKDREIDVGRLVSRDPQGRPNLERRVRPPRSVCPQHVGESAIFQRFKIAPQKKRPESRHSGRTSSAKAARICAQSSIKAPRCMPWEALRSTRSPAETSTRNFFLSVLSSL